jgi:FkbM family methyltransferase
MIKKIINKLKYVIQIPKRNYSFSQYGEDSIILIMLNIYKIRNANFIDIGAHHPYKYSNTALLYSKGLNGVNIEPDPILFKKFIKKRSRDINLNIGIHKEQGESVLYQFDKPEFNTFSLEAAISVENKGIKRVSESVIKINTFNNIVNDYLYGKSPDIIFLDAEGLDEIIIKSIDFDKFPPKIICIETYAYGVGEKNYEIIDYIKSKGYSIHADTFVNTIFIQTKLAKGILT